MTISKMKKTIKRIICFLLSKPYGLALKFGGWYSKYTNACQNGCDDCYNYRCPAHKNIWEDMFGTKK